MSGKSRRLTLSRTRKTSLSSLVECDATCTDVIGAARKKNRKTVAALELVESDDNDEVICVPEPSSQAVQYMAKCSSVGQQNKSNFRRMSTAANTNSSKTPARKRKSGPLERASLAVDSVQSVSPPASSLTKMWAGVQAVNLVSCPLCGEKMVPRLVDRHIESNCRFKNTSKQLKTEHNVHINIDMSKLESSEKENISRPSVDWFAPPPSVMAVAKLISRHGQWMQLGENKMNCPQSRASSEVYNTSHDDVTDDEVGDQSSPTPQIPYFVKNFQVAFNSIMSSKGCRGLFLSHELERIESKILGDIHRRKMGAVALIVRLLNRKIGWFRVNDLKYPKDVGDATAIKAAVDSLVEDGLVRIHSREVNAGLRLEDLLKALDVVKIREVRKSLGISGRPPKTKSTMISELQKWAATQSTLQSAGIQTGEGLATKRALSFTGPLVMVDPALYTLYRRVELVFFANREFAERTLVAITLSAIGKNRYPKYIVDSEAPSPWACRCELLRYEAALELEHTFELAMEKRDVQGILDVFTESIEVQMPPSSFPWRLKKACGDNCEVCNTNRIYSQPSFLQQYSAQHVLTRIIYVIVDILSTGDSKDVPRATKMLRKLLQQPLNRERRGRWYDKLALLEHFHLGHPEEALKVCMDGISDGHVRTGHLFNLVKRAERICKSRVNQHLTHLLTKIPRLGLLPVVEWEIAGNVIDKYEESERSGAGGSINYVFTNEFGEDIICGVEELVIREESKTGWNGLHCEGRLFGIMFRLLFWDTIFANVPSVFITKYQLTPLDFGTPDFYIQRQGLIERRLQEIRDCNDVGALLNELCSLHEDEIDLPEMYTAEILGNIATCIGKEVIAQVCWLLAVDYQHRGGGLPDLLLWKMPLSNEDAPLARFVEVKSPADRLSEKQIIWLHVLCACGADASVAKVVHAGARQ